MQQKSKLSLALTLSAGMLLALTACGLSQQAQPAATETVTVTASPEASSSSGSVSTSASSTGAEKSADSSSAASSSEQILNILDAVEQEYPGSTVISVDRDSTTGDYEVKAVDKNLVLELHVGNDGSVTIKESETDAEDVSMANEAAVSVREAISTATAQRPGETVDDAELDRKNGQLVWEIEFDSPNGKDSGSTRVNAADGKII